MGKFGFRRGKAFLYLVEVLLKPPLVRHLCNFGQKIIVR